MFKSLVSVLIGFSIINTVELLDLPFVSDAQDLIGLAHDVGDIAAGNVPLKGWFVATVNPINVIMDTVTQLVDQVTTLGNELNGKLDSVLNAILVRVPLEGKVDDDMKELVNYMSKIDRTYDDFEIYTEFPEDYERSTLLGHINHVIGKNSGDLQDMLYSMLIIVVPPKSALQRASFLENIKQLRNISDNKELCDLDMSFQYRLYKIYNILMITELKAFIMSQFAYKQLSEINNQNIVTTGEILKKAAYIGEMKRSQAKYIMRANQYQLEVKRIMQGASREVYRCAPKKLVTDENYLEFERLLSSYVINEYMVSNCQGGCSDRYNLDSHGTSYGVSISSGMYGGISWRSYNIYNKCEGRLTSCGWIGGQVDICENYVGARKRYQYVRSRANGYYGKWTNCEGAHYQSIYTFTNSHFDCDNCMCTCFENKAESTAIRTLNLRPQISNIEENKVVSNLRFVLKDKMMHIQIEEAPLLPVGLLNPNYTNWVPLGDFEYFSNITDKGGFMLKTDDNEYSNLTEDIDYAFMKYERLRFNLDEISAEVGYVVTGARWNFENPDDKDSSNYQLEIHVTPFNFSSGKLTPSDDNPSIWLTPTTQPHPPVEYTEERTEQMPGFKVQFEETGDFTPILMKNKYVNLVKSNWDDGGQSTVPYFDARPVITSYNLAYDGIGTVFFESDNGHAGLVGLKVMTIDLINYIKPELKPKQLKFYKKLYREPLRHDPIKAM